MFKKCKRTVLTGSIIFILVWHLYENREVEIHTPSPQGEDLFFVMPLRDKKRLEYFFYELFVRDSGAYTLFGGKPMFMGGYREPFATSSWEDFVVSLFPCNLRIYNGWKTWQKYQHRFPMERFLVWAEKNPFWKEPHSSIALILIHKQKFHETIHTYDGDFQAVLECENISAEELLLQRKNRLFLKEVLKNHDGLIGTLFGFGRDNSWLFEARKQGKPVSLSAVWDEEIYKFLEARSESIWSSYDISKNLDYPSFAVDPNSTETEQLKKKFLAIRNKILAYYKDKDLVEATLGLLIHGVPDF